MCTHAAEMVNGQNVRESIYIYLAQYNPAHEVPASIGTNAFPLRGPQYHPGVGHRPIADVSSHAGATGDCRESHPRPFPAPAGAMVAAALIPCPPRHQQPP